MRPETTILTFTYNKPQFLREAAQSVLNQTSGDWRWWVILDGASEETTDIAHDLARREPRITLFTERVEDRYALYRPAVLANKYVPMVQTPYLCSLGDDDLKEPCFVEVLVDALEANPGYQVAYGICRTFLQSGEEWIHEGTLPADRSWRFGPGSAISPDCRLNDGQVLQTKAAWDKLGWRFPIGFGKATHIDGVYLAQLATHFDFLFVHVNVHRHRHSYLSENNRGSATRELERCCAVELRPVLADRIESEDQSSPPLGYVDRALMVGHLDFLYLEGWLVASEPEVRSLWLGKAHGEEVAAAFQYRREDSPIVCEHLVGVIPAAHRHVRYSLFIEAAGATFPLRLRLELGDGSIRSAELPAQFVKPVTETLCRDLLHQFGGTARDSGRALAGVAGPAQCRGLTLGRYADSLSAPEIDAETKMRLGVVIPLANEEASLDAFLTRVLAQLEAEDGIFCVVDEASRDRTREAVESWRPRDGRVQLVWAPENRCVVDAYFRGYRAAMEAGCQWILEMDGGFSHLPEEIPQFVRAMELGYDYVGGCRFMPGGAHTGSYRRYVLSWGGSVLSRCMLGTRMKDMTSGFECFSRRALAAVLCHGVRSRAHFFQTEIKFLLRNWNWIEVPIHYCNSNTNVAATPLCEAFGNLWRLYRQLRAERRTRRRAA